MTTELTAIRKKLEKKLKEERYIYPHSRRHVHRCFHGYAPWSGCPKSHDCRSFA